MQALVCGRCGHPNAAGVRYCQRCGCALRPRHTLRDEIRSWDPSSLAGAGRRDSNFAALYTVLGPRPAPGRQKKPAVPADPLPDGRWYCPDCGTLNTPAAAFCTDCGRTK